MKSERYNKIDMPWLEERTLILFVRDTQIRRYEPGVREGRIDVDSEADSDADANSNPNTWGLPLERRRDGVVHSDGLVRQHLHNNMGFKKKWSKRSHLVL